MAKGDKGGKAGKGDAVESAGGVTTEAEPKYDGSGYDGPADDELGDDALSGDDQKGCDEEAKSSRDGSREGDGDEAEPEADDVTYEGAFRLVLGIDWTPDEPPPLDVVPGLMDVLPPEQRNVLVWLYGADGEDPIDAAAVAKRLRTTAKLVGETAAAATTYLKRVLKLARAEGLDKVRRIFNGPSAEELAAAAEAKNRDRAGAMTVAIRDELARMGARDITVEQMGPVTVVGAAVTRAQAAALSGKAIPEHCPEHGPGCPGWQAFKEDIARFRGKLPPDAVVTAKPDNSPPAGPEANGKPAAATSDPGASGG